MSAATTATPGFDHIVVVIEENHAYEKIIGNPEASYINSLATLGALFTNYHAITHPSQPNYFALYAGSTFGVDNNVYQETGPTIATILQGAGDTFIGFVESGSPQRHNPWESFPEGVSVERNIDNFPENFADLPTVSFIVPNLLDDMHDGTIAQGDQWLRTHFDGYARWAKDHNSLLVITWDEADDGLTNHVPMIFYGANVYQGTFGGNYNHYDLLATVLGASGLTAPNSAAHTTGVFANIGLNDFDGDGPSDLLWRNHNGTFTEWQSTGTGFTPNVVVNSTVSEAWHSEGTFDFGGDGRADLLWRNDASGQFTIWNSTGSGFSANNFVGNGVDTSWKVAALADFNGDGMGDLIWRNDNGTFTEWQSTGTGFIPNVVVNSTVNSTWHLAAAADFDGDGKSDLLWRNDSGQFTEWQSTGSGFTPNVVDVSSVDPTWHILGTGDFNGDGKADLLFRHNNGTFTEWQSTGNGFTPNVVVVSSVNNTWHLAQVGDFNADSKDDLLWRNDNGTFTEWESTGSGFTPNVVVNSTVGTDWTLVTHHYDLV